MSHIIKNWRQEQVKVYDEMVEKSPTGHQYIYTKRTLRLLDRVIPKKGKILDIGCGTGHIAQNLDREWYGVDISPKSIEVAKKYYKEAKVGDITKKIPFKNNFFDIVLSISTLHHTFDHINEVVSEVKKVLKNNGLFIIIEHDARNLHTRMLHNSFLKLVPCKHERALNIEDVTSILEKNNFQILSKLPIDIEAEQQALKPPIYVRIFKTPILLFLKFLMFGKSGEFLIKAKLKK